MTNDRHASESESDGHRGNYGDHYSAKRAGKPFIDAHLLAQGYQLARTFFYELPDRTWLYEERRYEVRAGITPTKGALSLGSRAHHQYRFRSARRRHVGFR
jgi:hypothetical protein